MKKKKWDIKKHIESHAYYFKQYQPIKDDDLHFNVSFLDIQFFNRDKKPEQIMMELLKELKKPATYKITNGYYVSKTGEKKRKYTKRKINLAKEIKEEAIHVIGADNEYTMPHFHFLFGKKAKLGINYSLLKRHITEVSAKFGLIPNFAETSSYKYKNLAQSVKNYFWIIKKIPNNEFKKYIQKDNFLNKLEKLREYTILSGNLLYYVKTMNSIRKRLQNLRLDKKIIVDGKEFNLRNNYPIPLTEQDKKVLDLINERIYTQKAIKEHLDNAIMRDYIRYCYFKDLDKAIILKELLRETTLIKPNIKPNSKALNNYLKLHQKQVKAKIQELKEKEEKRLKEKAKEQDKLSIKDILKEDLLKVAKICKTDKELRQKMQELGYKEFGFKKRNNKIYAYQFVPPAENKKIIVKCADTIDIKIIREILKENYYKYKETLTEASKTQIKSKIESYTLPKDIKPQIKTLPIIYKREVKPYLKEMEEKTQELYKQAKLLLQLQPEIKEKEKEKEEKEEVKFKLDLPSLNLTIPTKIKQDFIKEIKNAKDIRDNIKYIKYRVKRFATITREVKRLSEFERENSGAGEEKSTIGREIKSFRERITESITGSISNTFKRFGSRIANTISTGLNEFKRRIKKTIRDYLESKPKQFTDEEKIVIINYLIKEAVEYSEKQFFLTEYQIKKRVIREAKEKFGIDEKFTNTYLFKKDIYDIYEIANLDINLNLGFKIKGLK